jgi:cell wall-associated NlpC family hydrolase
MQFEPETWREYGDGGNPDNPRDAIFAAARLLKADGAPGNWYQAIFGYNHADWYVEEVEGYAREYAAEVPGNALAGGSLSGGGGTLAPEVIPADGCHRNGGEASTVAGESAKLLPNGLAAAPADAPQPVKTMIAAGNQIAALPYVWGGHHVLGSPTNGYDCSSAVSYVMYAGGLLPPGSAGFKGGDFYTSFLAESFVAGGSVGGLQSGPGRWVTLYSNGEHVFMTIAGIRFDDSSDELRNGKGPNGTNISMWQPLIDLPGFAMSHPANL